MTNKTDKITMASLRAALPSIYLATDFTKAVALARGKDAVTPLAVAFTRYSLNKIHSGTAAQDVAAIAATLGKGAFDKRLLKAIELYQAQTKTLENLPLEKWQEMADSFVVQYGEVLRPAVKKAAPATNEAAPATNEAAPATNEAAPATNEAAPIAVLTLTALKYQAAMLPDSEKQELLQYLAQCLNLELV
jgi:hypothetical protein